jgi:hypothetical protein
VARILSAAGEHGRLIIWCMDGSEEPSHPDNCPPRADSCPGVQTRPQCPATHTPGRLQRKVVNGSLPALLSLEGTSRWTPTPMRRLEAREKRIVLYFAVFLAVLAWDIRRRWWTPTAFLETPHFTIRSSATQRQTEETGTALEILHEGYARLLGELGQVVPEHARLKVRLFGSRDEFRFCNRIRGWEEGFYRAGCSYQYYAPDAVNPYDSAMHEAAHQLNAEATRLSLPRWLEEGFACYLAASRIVSNRLSVGEVDTNTYPVWWLEEFGTSGNLEADKQNGSAIPLNAILTGKGGPSMREAFNQYYVHWWSLTHFLLHGDGGRHRHLVASILADKDAASRLNKDIVALEPAWYAHTLGLKRSIAGRATPAPLLRTEVRR